MMTFVPTPASTGNLRRLAGTAVAAATAALLAVSAVPSCGGAGSASDPPGSPAAPASAGPSGTPRLLAAGHPGWKSQRCNACHAVPATGHQAVEPWVCAQCHGGNGACNPNGRSAVRRHATTDSCLACHQQAHQFTTNTQCLGCHFASTGVVACPGTSGPGSPGALVSGCFGWPAVDFSPTNKAGVATFLRPGQQAVAFALGDATGSLVRLSDLLGTRPVLLVHGSFT